MSSLTYYTQKMGNENSQMAGLEIDKKAVDVTDFYMHYAATLNANNVTSVSVFVGGSVVIDTRWYSQAPLKKATKNLMLYRHPCIVKYISSWEKGSKFYLAVEDVRPLAHVLPTLSGLQVCIGLHSILKALCFLHEKALSSHNNVCIGSIYVAKDGNWKLSGMEYLCRFNELNSDCLFKMPKSRYEKAIDPNETAAIKTESRRDFIDIYAFGVLACEVLQKFTDEEIPYLDLFKNVCKNDLQNVDIKQRPKLITLLENPFFQHDFITVHSFLTELPLKSDSEKDEFFTSLLEKLRTFKEETVASQLGGLLLSRLVLLNKTAQKDLLPWVLSPRRETEIEDRLFSEDNFRKFVIPKLLEIFCVRDAEIRKLLLKYFVDFVDCFAKEELQNQVLPELLVGIKDTNDHLVAVTLRALADLVPILGASTVIGGKRAKLFTDGRPLVHSKRLSRNSVKPSRIVEPLPNLIDNDIIENENNVIGFLPFTERSRPDGEEGDTSTEDVEQSAEEDLEAWQDWDVNENPSNDQISVVVNSPSVSVSSLPTEINQNVDVTSLTPQIELPKISTETKKKRSLPDIFELDIKNQRNGLANGGDEFDYFQDMEPTIQSTAQFIVEEKSIEIDGLANGVTNRLNLEVKSNENNDDGDGWGEEDWD